MHRLYKDQKTAALIAIAEFIPAILVTGVFIVPALTGSFLPLTDEPYLSHIVQMQWVAMAGGVFLIFPLAIAAISPEKQVLATFVFAFFVLFLCSLVYQEWGLYEIPVFVALVYFNYGGQTLFIANEKLRHSKAIFAVMWWIFACALYFSLLISFDLGGGSVSSIDGPDAIRMGAIFFLVLLLTQVSVLLWLEKRIEWMLGERVPPR